nr:hypothetical protein [Syntrophales bacterium]
MFKRSLILLIGMIVFSTLVPPALMALTDGPDAGGYVYYDSHEEGVIPFVWESILNSKTSVVVPEFQSVAKEGGEEAILSHPIDIGF